ncbi:atpase aaa [Plasmopara halstedii]|uniref:Atpase aaa n=1 Tax=Plasmopara halstedii TaxID=4781 RepID=A0A0P1AZB6_PLAHL|nr:atpase aaa [Plasmopara halstedii]CEG47154.1 atpase aaa [Plasmopara halstedii]|eukprot:XP_024583523.1 atpase aaa [Plasmopara halstedii]
MRVEVIKSGNNTSTAWVSVATFDALHAVWGCYLMLKCCERHRSRAFRLEIDENMEDRGTKVQIDHWPMCNEDENLSGICSHNDTIEVQVVAPSNMNVVQCLALAPWHGQQIKLTLTFIKSLLRGRILTGRAGYVTLQRDGMQYGNWIYEGYFRGHSGDKAEVFDGGVVTDQTLVLIYPSAMSLPTKLLAAKPIYQPVGIHARQFRDLVAMSFQHTSLLSFEAAVRIAPHSLLLHAPSGAGKSTLVHQIAEEMGASLLLLDGGLLASPQLCIEDFFSAALRIQPCVLLIEDIELMFPLTMDEIKHKLVCQLVKCIECIQKANMARVVVIGTVSLLSMLHLKVRQAFTEEFFLDVPDKIWMVNLLKSLLPPSELLRQEFLMSLAVRYGQKPSNIVSIAQEICTRLSRKDSQHIGIETMESEIAASARQISSTSNHVEAVRSSVPSVSWEDIGGLEDVKQSLIEMVVWPLEKPHVFRRMGISPPLGLILHGPPGTGKTMLAKATAKASGCNFLNLSASDLMKAEFGESEKAIARAFDTARALSPCMIFIDEFQSLFGNRSTAGQTTSRMISQLLMELDASKAVSDDSNMHASDLSLRTVAGRIFVLAATNVLTAIDPAFLQPGRFENVVYVGLPNANERKAIFEIQRKKMPWSQDVDLDKLVEETDGENAASLIALCQVAAIQAMHRIPPNAPEVEQCIGMVDFVSALAKENCDIK